jgi:hypothetical protein
MRGEANLGPAFALEADWDRNRTRTLDRVLQVVIAVLSLSAMFLITSTSPYARWGFVIGMASQPFWFLATWRARQHGMFVCAIFYTGAWAQGIATRFF